MANTSAADLAGALRAILQHNNGSGSVNLYMAHGGTNWGLQDAAMLLQDTFPATAPKGP